jgi:hypothetical protein
MDTTNSNQLAILSTGFSSNQTTTMRTRILFFCIVVLAICVWLLLRRSREEHKATNPYAIAQISTNYGSQPVQKQAAEKYQIPVAATANATNPAARSNTDARRKMLLEQIQEAWRTPIEFYGMVIDESNNPVTGADIIFDCNDLSEKGTSFYKQTSDESGMFSLTGVRGEGITVHVSKEGYYTSRQDRDNFEYAQNGANNFVPDSANPVVFHLRKKRKGESLIQRDFPPGMQIWQLHHDGTSVELDLLNGSQNPNGSGQLKLEFWRDISDINKQPFDWKLQLSVPGGGLVGTDQEFPFEAPKIGYQSSIVIDMPATNQDWLGELRSKYYLQLPNGNYGRIDFYLLPYNGVFTVHSAVNPSGSQSLEP